MTPPMNVSTVVIGAGHAGLAMSRRLIERSIDHVVLEHGAVANSWRTERWDSLRLLTPNWQVRLPGMADHDDDPDGFMTMPEVVKLIDDYAATIDAPVQTGTTVTGVTATDNGYAVATDRGDWRCTTLVLASGAANIAIVPPCADGVPSSVAMVTPITYRSPEQLADSRVLVVGASATGVQLADEIHRSGRPVTLAVGEHVRMPRTYRGRDIFWWMEASGVLDERTTRSTTSSGPVMSRRLSLSERPNVARSISPRSESSASSSSAVLDRCVTELLCARVRSPTRAGSPTSSWIDCSNVSTSGPAVRIPTRWTDHIDRSRPRRRPTPRSPSICVAAVSTPSSGRPAIARTTPGWSCQCSTAVARSGTTAVSYRDHPACTCSAATC